MTTAKTALPSCIVTSFSVTDSLPVHELFPVRQPLEVDVGCGKGRFLLARAARFPDINFLGVDRLLKRIRKVDRKVARAGLRNVRLLSIEAAYAVEHLIPDQSVSAFYVFFPDPWPKRRHHRRRLFATPDFLSCLHSRLVPGGLIHLATDHEHYFLQIQALFRGDPRFEEIPAFQPTEEERTDFELLFLAQNATIGRGSFRRR